METLIFTFDTVALMVAIYFSIKSEKSPDKPDLGPFRIRPYQAKAAEQPAPDSRALRAVRRR